MTETPGEKRRTVKPKSVFTLCSCSICRDCPEGANYYRERDEYRCEECERQSREALDVTTEESQPEPNVEATDENDDYTTALVSGAFLHAAGLTHKELARRVDKSNGRCACGRKEAWVSSRATTASCGYCSTTGAHVVVCIEVGCETHTYWGGVVAHVGRACPQDCRWSQGNYINGEWVPEDKEE